MCHFLELEFACSSDNQPHRLRTRAIYRCEDPFDCLAEEVVTQKSESEAGTTVEDWADEKFTIMKVGGDCEKCSQQKTKELEHKEKILSDIQANLVEMDQDLSRLSFEGIQKPRKEIPTLSLSQIHEDKAEHHPETICSSGGCKGLVAVSLDGRRGFFCKKHTCAATDWGCLSDVSTTRNSSQFSIYCPLHTCGRLGCGLKIADLSTVFCTKHQHEIDLAISSRN
ncbi:hypothetical protein FSARC_5171 [Fusarium sarcochroum]|uniref:Uncharacterized protein n=1 Tax=Fusarium sarcochroum TaxID=1208366 RepID=A0A8H4U038_9HYPO|nr:hypothetical protein FSARC_5171 [Fusarium sarcochroum]